MRSSSLVVALCVLGPVATNAAWTDGVSAHSDGGYCYAHGGNSVCALDALGCTASGEAKMATCKDYATPTVTDSKNCWKDHSTVKSCSISGAEKYICLEEGTSASVKKDCKDTKFGGCYNTATHKVRPVISSIWCESGETFVKHDSSMMKKTYGTGDVKVGFCKSSDGKNPDGTFTPSGGGVSGGFCAITKEQCNPTQCSKAGCKKTGYSTKCNDKASCEASGYCSVGTHTTESACTGASGTWTAKTGGAGVWTVKKETFQAAGVGEHKCTLNDFKGAASAVTVSKITVGLTLVAWLASSYF